MLRLAVIFEGSPFDRKGLFNAVHNRVRHLLDTGECSVDVFCVHSWDSPFSRRRRGTPYVGERCGTVAVDGIEYKMLWYDFSLVDFFLVEKLRVRPFFFRKEVRRWLPMLSGYDCIAAHSFTGGLIAREASSCFGMPYYVTWHGSDVHTHPLCNSLKFKDTASVMREARCNFFVSEALLKASERIVPGCGSGTAGGYGAGPDSGSDAAGCGPAVRKEVLYNGVGEEFVRFPDFCREELRMNNGLSSEDKVVGFVGSIVAVKNVGILQELFHEIAERYAEAAAGGMSGNGAPAGLKFWMVGDGKLRSGVEAAMVSDSSIDVSFWGNIPVGHMPSMMNCIDVMVLPSLNEGLPLVCAEAVRCGAAVVGSAAGGIPEVIGKDSVVPFGPDFISDFASKVVSYLVSPPVQELPASLDWNETARKELSFLKSL